MKAKKVLALLCAVSMFSGTLVTVSADTAQNTDTAVTAEAAEESEAAAADAYDARLDAGKIILTPGEDETALNFS